jgi:hypothetical protein
MRTLSFALGVAIVASGAGHGAASASLAAPSTADIHGQVVAPSGRGLAKISVKAIRAGSTALYRLGGDVTNSDGEFRIPDVAVGERVRLVYTDWSQSGEFATEYSTAFRVGAAGETRNRTLELGGSVSGHIAIDPAAVGWDRGPRDMVVRAIGENHEFTAKVHDFDYSIDGLPEGEYVLNFSSPKSAQYLPTYFGGPGEADAQIVSVTAGEDTGGTDVVVTPSASVSVGVSVNGKPIDSTIGDIDRTLTSSSGEVRGLVGLPAGDYTLSFTPSDEKLGVKPYTLPQTLALEAGDRLVLDPIDLALVPGARLPTSVTARMNGLGVRYGKSDDLIVTVASYGDIAGSTVSLKHHGKIRETADVKPNGRVRFSINSTEWKKTARAKMRHVALIYSGTSSTQGTTEQGEFETR